MKDRIKDRSSSDGEPALPKILSRTMQKGYKMKEIEYVLFFLLPLLEHVFDDTCVAQKIKVSVKDFFSKCDQIRRSATL